MMSVFDAERHQIVARLLDKLRHFIVRTDLRGLLGHSAGWRPRTHPRTPASSVGTAGPVSARPRPTLIVVGVRSDMRAISCALLEIDGLLDVHPRVIMRILRHAEPGGHDGDLRQCQLGRHT